MKTMNISPHSQPEPKASMDSRRTRGRFGVPSPGFGPRFSTLAAVWWLSAAVGLAYPPAPFNTLYGNVRDQYGTPLTSSTALVLLATPAGVLLSAPIAPGVGPGMNYQLRVPMDAGSTPVAYQKNALTAAAPYKLWVVVNGVTNVPLQMTGSFAALGKPGAGARMDLTLGVDANGDGIPDAWEQAVLNAYGLNANLSSLHANSVLFADGRTLMQQFLLGNVLFNPNDSFSVSVVKVRGGSPVLQFSTMTGRTYTLLGSADMKSWSPVAFTLEGDATGRPYNYYYATGIQSLQAQVIQPASGAAMCFFRVALQ